MSETAILQPHHGCALAVDHDKPGSIKLNRSHQIYEVLGTPLCCVAMDNVGVTDRCRLRVRKEGRKVTVG